MKNNMVECPNCLGIGEIVTKKGAATCKICKGKTQVDPVVESAYIEKLRILE